MNKNKIILTTFFVVVFSSLIFLICYFEIPRVTYSYQKETDSYIVDYVYGNYKEFNVKEMHNGKKVTGIKRYAFSKQTKLEKITLSNNIIEIGELAFYKCKSLKEISFPSNVEIIRNNAFLGCENLENVYFRDNSNLKIIEGSAFFDCVNLTEVILPNTNNYSIGDYAFYNTNIKMLKVSASSTVTYKNCLNSVNSNCIFYY